MDFFEGLFKKVKNSKKTQEGRGGQKRLSKVENDLFVINHPTQNNPRQRISSVAQRRESYLRLTLWGGDQTGSSTVVYNCVETHKLNTLGRDN